MGRLELNISTASATPVSQTRFYFLLLPGFSSLDLGAGIESLAAANATSARAQFVWKIIAETDQPVTSASGIMVSIDEVLPNVRRGDCIVICGGLDETQHPSRALKAWLRRASRFGAKLCGVGGSAALVAELGLSVDNRLSVHWKLQPALAEKFPGLDTVCNVYEEQKTVVTCGGGAATLDLFAALIRRECGDEVALDVADQLLCSSIRSSGDRQTRSDLCRLGSRHQKLAHAIQVIQENLDETLSPSGIAEEVGLSTRQMERLFQRYIGTSPRIYITSLRLDKARVLLMQTQMPVVEVAMACGFSSASHFSRLYRKKFSTSPHQERGIT